MTSLVEKALTAKRESKTVEFKQGFDCESKGDWCEVIKDLVAMANSGGGIVVFGLGNKGETVGFDCAKIAALDPADVSNKVGAYIGSSDFDFSIVDLNKGKTDIVAIRIGPATTPYVFERPGDYADLLRKPKSAFARGTIYFRHNAKSEPATNDDIRKAISRQIDALRKEWVTGLRKVVEAPAGSTILVSNEEHPTRQGFKIDDAPGATPVRLTRNRDEATGTILYEQISATLFGEINNVIEANRILFPDQGKFLLGVTAYYRIYAERRQVDQPPKEIEKLLFTGILEYSPLLHWQSQLLPETFVSYLVDIYLWPKVNEVFILLRVAILLGDDFCKWLLERFTRRWGRYSQAPGFYYGFLAQVQKGSFDNPYTLATKTGPQTVIQVIGESPVTVEQMLKGNDQCDNLLSKACRQVFTGNSSMRSVCRLLDVLCHGSQIINSRQTIIETFIKQVGERLPDQE